MAAPVGNKNATKEKRIVGDTLRRVAVQNPKKLRAACEALLDKAADGDVAAYKEIRDTLDGKVTSVHVEQTGTVTHEHISVSAVIDRIEEMLRTGTDQPGPTSLPH